METITRNKERIQGLINTLKDAKENGLPYDQNNLDQCSIHYTWVAFPNLDQDVDYQNLYGISYQEFEKLFWLEQRTLYGWEASRTIDEQINNLQALMDGPDVIEVP